MEKTTRSPDPTIDRIRSARREISERFGHDTAKLVAHYIALQERHPERLLAARKTVEPEDRPAA